MMFNREPDRPMTQPWVGTFRLDERGLTGHTLRPECRTPAPQSSATAMDDRNAARSRESNPRERILEAAEVLFARHGLDKTTLADIARRAGLSKATLYHHFPAGKESIFREAVNGIIETRWQRLLTYVRAGTSAADRLRRYLSERIAVFDREVTVRGISPEVWTNLKPWIDLTLESHLERDRGLIRDIVEEGVQEGWIRPVDPEFAARLIQSALQGLTVDGPLETAALARQRDTDALIRFIERGLGSEGDEA
jgi:AcrR family transcriptional regulator